MSHADDVRSQVSIQLALPPSCIQVCPKYPEYFVVGTYSLQEEDTGEANERSAAQRRQGSIVLFQWMADKMQVMTRHDETENLANVPFLQNLYTNFTASGSHSRLTLPGFFTAALQCFRDGVK